MEVKNLFDPVVKQDIIARINKLTPQSQRLWGKMNVSQMLAHLQPAIKIAYGTHKPKGHFFFKLILPFFKSTLWDDKPYKKGLPTDKTFIMTGSEKDFEKEKAAVLELIHQFSEPNLKGERHPVFGKITKENWSKAIWKHIDHHLQQFGV